ncbi:MAG: hypothetical protein MN733_23040, partial [Nitrososphaera sp.]|nr:hypothetical protein [Nitrososphaera sp.]
GEGGRNDKMIKRIILVTFLLALALPTWAESPKIDPDQRYLLLATKKTSTMQKELDGVAAQGFRVVVGLQRVA